MYHGCAPQPPKYVINQLGLFNKVPQKEKKKKKITIIHFPVPLLLLDANTQEGIFV